MPIYEFACRSCDAQFEELVRTNGAKLEVSCPHCGATDITRLLSVFSVRTSGSGDPRPIEAGSGPNGGCCGGSCGCR